MKKIHSFLTGAAMLLFFSVRAQIGTPGGDVDIDPGGGTGVGCDASCLNGTLNISTG